MEDFGFENYPARPIRRYSNVEIDDPSEYASPPRRRDQRSAVGEFEDDSPPSYTPRTPYFVLDDIDDPATLRRPSDPRSEYGTGSRVMNRAEGRARPGSRAQLDQRSVGHQQLPTMDDKQSYSTRNSGSPQRRGQINEPPVDRLVDVDHVSEPVVAPLPPRRAIPTIKLGQYTGSTPLETFLAKVDNCAEYYSWTEREKLHHLRASLDGAAGQVLWDAGSQTSVKDIVRLLRNRFGSQHQAERFRAELRARRRQKGESLQTVYQDVRRLIALAFPGESGSLYEIVARDSFLEAIDNPAIRLRVLEREPPTLDEALSLATRLEALGFQNEDHHVVEDKRVKERQVRVVGARPNDETKTGWNPSDGRVHELEGTVNELRRQIAEERKQAETWRQLVQQQNTTVGPPIAPWPAPVAAPVPPTVWAPPNAEYVQQPGSNAMGRALGRAVVSIRMGRALGARGYRGQHHPEAEVDIETDQVYLGIPAGYVHKLDTGLVNAQINKPYQRIYLIRPWLKRYMAPGFHRRLTL